MRDHSFRILQKREIPNFVVQGLYKHNNIIEAGNNTFFVAHPEVCVSVHFLPDFYSIGNDQKVHPHPLAVNLETIIYR